MDTNVIEHQKRDQGSKNTGFGKAENNKHPSAEGEQHTGRNKLKEEVAKTNNKQQIDKTSGRNKWSNGRTFRGR